MRLTERTDYALRVLMVLGASRRRHTVPALAAAFGVSANHLAKIVQLLHGFGWVETQSGRGGGVALTVSSDAVTIGDVVRATEPDLNLVQCLREPGGCPLEGPCRLVPVLRRARGAFLAELDSVTLADLVDGRRAPLLRAVPAALSVEGASR